MLKMLFGLDQKEVENNSVVEASSLLDVGEFQIFQLGYESWYGKEGDLQYLEKCFFSYLLENKTTAWARHFARHIIVLDQKGELESHAPEYHRFDPESVRPISKTIGTVQACAILLFCLGFISFISIISSGGIT